MGRDAATEQENSVIERLSTYCRKRLTLWRGRGRAELQDADLRLKDGRVERVKVPRSPGNPALIVVPEGILTWGLTVTRYFVEAGRSQRWSRSPLRYREVTAYEPVAERAISGIELIAAERERQVTQEGWTAEHDDTHTVGQLAMAAATYAFPWSSFRAQGGLAQRVRREELWPWGDVSFKPAGRGRDHRAERVRELAKAGALIAAEIDRMQRAQEATDGD